MTRKMKDSGIEWIGEIPEHWEVRKLKNLGYFSASGIDKKIKNGERKIKIVNYVDIYHSTSKILRNENYMEVTTSSEKIKKHNLIKGDVLFTPSSETIEEIGYSAVIDQDLINTSYSYHLLRFRFNNQVIHDYKKFMFNNEALLNQFASRARGTTRKTLNRIDFEQAVVPIPKKSEQKMIADFLDRKTQKMDNIISRTKKAIEEYKNYKQSLITETATKGLDKNVEMKDSGIEWIGDIPEHWDTIKFKNLFKFGSGLTITKSNLVDEGIKVINYGEIHSKYKFDLDINRDELNCVNKSYLEKRKSALINKGDFVFCDTSEDREGSGNCIVLRENNDELIFAGSHTVIARLIRNVNPIYIRYMIMASSVNEQISSSVVGIKVFSITQAILKQIIGVIPPLKEQEQIAIYLDEEIMQIDQIISNKEKLLKKIEAYKKSLIYETVTGKRKVE